MDSRAVDLTSPFIRKTLRVAYVPETRTLSTQPSASEVSTLVRAMVLRPINQLPR
jgi:hypothetical protein